MAIMLIRDLGITINLLLGKGVACKSWHAFRSGSLTPIFGAAGGQFILLESQKQRLLCRAREQDSSLQPSRSKVLNCTAIHNREVYITRPSRRS